MHASIANPMAGNGLCRELKAIHSAILPKFSRVVLINGAERFEDVK